MWPNLTLLEWLANSPRSPLRVDLRPFVPAFPPQLSLTDELKLPSQSAWIIGASLAIVLLGYLLMTRSQAVKGVGRLPYRVHAVIWVGVVGLVGLGWYTGNVPYLKHRTVLVRQNEWPLVPRLSDPHGIAYLDGKIYTTDYRGGQVGELDLSTGVYRLVSPVSASGPLTFTHPGDIKAGPDKLLYVLNNGENEEALYVMKPDGQVVRTVGTAYENADWTGHELWRGRQRNLRERYGTGVGV